MPRLAKRLTQGVRMGFTARLLALIVVAVAGCAEQAGVTRKVESVASMTDLIQREVPVGTRHEQAQQFMQHEGFKCSMRRKEESSEQESTDCLYCDRSDPVDFLVGRRWQVTIGLRDELVSDVSVSMYYVGP